MAQPPAPATQPPVTEENFEADKDHFWSSWCHFVLAAVITIVVILILMAVFLV